MLCPRDMGCPPSLPAAAGSVPPAARGGGQVKWGGHHRQGGAPHPLHARHGGHTGDPPVTAVAGVPCPPLPCAPPPAPVCTTGLGVGTPQGHPLYSIPLQHLGRGGARARGGRHLPLEVPAAAWAGCCRPPRRAHTLGTLNWSRM